MCVNLAGRTVNGECQGEMLDYRRMLMEDFSLSPEIVLHCRGEIEAHCSGLHRKGRTLHCLMRVARGEKGAAMDSMCQNAVSSSLLLSLLIGCRSCCCGLRTSSVFVSEHVVSANTYCG